MIYYPRRSRVKIILDIAYVFFYINPGGHTPHPPVMLSSANNNTLAPSPPITSWLKLLIRDSLCSSTTPNCGGWKKWINTLNIFFANKQAFQNNFLKDQTQTILILVRPRYEFNKSKHHLHRRSGYSTE